MFQMELSFGPCLFQIDKEGKKEKPSYSVYNL